MFKKVSALVLSGAVAVSMLSGCGSSESTNGQNAQKPTLKVLINYKSYDPNAALVGKLKEEKTGYHIQYDMLPQQNPDDKINLIMASGEAYDYMNMNKALYTNYSKLNALTEIGSLIDKYGPNVKSGLTEDNLKLGKINDKLFGIPNIDGPVVYDAIMMRADWLEKLRIATPKTVDEFVAALKAFKEKDPGGNGQKNIPMTMEGTTALVSILAAAFDIPNDWNVRNGELVPRATDPNFKEYLTFFTGLYQQGVIEKEFPTNKATNVIEKFTSGLVGAIPFGWYDVPKIADALAKNNPNAKYVIVGPLKGKNGELSLKANLNISCGVIPKVSKNSKHVIQWINSYMDPEVFKYLLIGEEGVHYSKKDGSYYPILPKFMDERGNANDFITGSIVKQSKEYQPIRVRKDQRLFDAWDYLNNKQAEGVIKPYIAGSAVGLSDFSKYNASLSTMVNDYSIKVVSGAEKIEEFNKFGNTWMSAGGESSFKDINAWYKEKFGK